MIESELMPHLVHDDGEEVDVAGGGLHRIRPQSLRRKDIRELRIVEGSGIDKPATPSRVAIDGDMTGFVQAKPLTRQVGYTIVISSKAVSWPAERPAAAQRTIAAVARAKSTPVRCISPEAPEAHRTPPSAASRGRQVQSAAPAGSAPEVGRWSVVVCARCGLRH